VVVVVAAGIREVIPTMIQTRWSLLLLIFLLLHIGRRVGLGEYNIAGVCGVSRPLPSLSSTSTSFLSQCTQAIENEIEAKERKACCQTKKTQQGEENSIVISRRCDENNKNYEEKQQASSRKRSIDCEMGVDKIRPLRTKAKQQNKAANEENIQK